MSPPMGCSAVSVWLSLAALAITACGNPPVPPEAVPIRVSAEPPARLDAVPRVLRLRVENFGDRFQSLLLFQGTLTAYAIGRLRVGEIPTTLAERRVPAVAWSDGADAVLAPSTALEPSASYALAALGLGAIASIAVRADEEVYGRRVWPPPLAPRGGTRLVFCADAAFAAPEPRVRLDPSGIPATVAAGADDDGLLSDRCLRLDAPRDAELAGTVVVPPPSLGAVALDPAPADLGPADAAPAARACEPGELPLGPGCLVISDDRAVLRSAREPVLWSVRAGESESLTAAAPGASVLYAGLPPASIVPFVGAATSLAGLETPFSVGVHTLPPRPHVVLSEVLDNPIGAEPAQEWVELVNDGTVGVDVEGYVLADSGGDTVLPRGTLEPGEFALLVGHDYDPEAASDVPARGGTLLLRVPRVGVSGLSNDGEALKLRAPDGTVLSRMPALAAPKPGQSVARRDASALDDDPGAFGPTADGTASPGWENHIGTP